MKKVKHYAMAAFILGCTIVIIPVMVVSYFVPLRRNRKEPQVVPHSNDE